MEGIERPAWYSIVYLLFVGLCVGIMSFINSFQEQRHPGKQYVERSYRSVGTNKAVGDLSKSNVKPQSDKTVLQSDSKNETKEKVVVPSSNKGTIQTDEQFFLDLIEKYENNVLSKLERPEARTDVVVRYYSKMEDENLIYNLRKYGFYIHERPSGPAYKVYSTNSLYYGDDVKNEDIQLISYLLLESGVKLKKIQPSKLHDDWKSNSIEIGTDTLQINEPTLGLSDLRKNWH